jgi:hypothetical protein
LSIIFVDFIFVDFDKILDKFIYLFGIFLGNYFLLTLPSWYGTNLFSVSELVSNGLKVQFNLNKCVIKFCNGEVIAIALRKQNLYEINFVEMHESDMANLVQYSKGDGALELWHHCLGHLNMKIIQTLSNMVTNMNLGENSYLTSSLFCETYIKDK